MKFTTEFPYETSLLGPPPVALRHQSGGDDRTKTRRRPFFSQSHSSSMVCREDNRPGGFSDVYACDVPWVEISCLSFSRRRRALAVFAKALQASPSFFASVCSVILRVSATRRIGGITLAQLKEVTSTCSRLFRASLTISSSCLAILSSIQSAPH